MVIVMRKVSIILPTYNRGYIISRAIESVLKQTYLNWELIVVDDGSKDDTEDKVKAFEDSRIRYIHYEENCGGNHARNLGMKNSTGEYIAFLDSDCEWHNNYLKKQLDCFEDEKADVIFARTYIINNAYQFVFPVVSAKDLETEKKMTEQLLYESIFDTNVCMMKRTIYEKSRGFNENLRKLQDWEYFLRLLLEKKYRFKFNDQVLCTNYVQENSITNNPFLYWNARLHIFKDSIDRCRKLGVLTDVVNHMLCNENAQWIQPEEAQELFSFLNKEEKAELCRGYYNIHLQSLKSQEDAVRNHEDAVRNHEDAVNNFKLAMKNEAIIQLEKKWIQALRRGKNTLNYFYNHQIRNVCIYGYGVLGNLLYDELKNSEIFVSGVIDANVKSDEVSIFTLEEIENFDCDAIVITAVSAFYEISEMLREKTELTILSIKDIIESL